MFGRPSAVNTLSKQQIVAVTDGVFQVPVLQAFSKFYTVWFITHCFLIHIFCASIIYNLIVGNDKWSDFVFLLRRTWLAVTADILICRGRQLARFLKHIDSSFNALADEKRRAIRRFCVVVFSTAVVYVLGTTVASFLLSWFNDVKLQSANKLIQTHFFLYDVTRSENYLSMEGFIYIVYRLYFCNTSTVFPAIYLVLCRLLQENVDKFCRTIESFTPLSRNLTCNQVTDIQKQYIALSQLVREFNDLFGEVTFIWYTLSLAMLCYFSSLTLGHGSLSPSVMSEMYYNTVHVGLTVVIVSIGASEIPKTCQQCLLLLHKLFVDTKHARSLECQSQLWLTLERVSVAPLGATLGKMFLIDRQFFASFVGVLVTFVVFSIQMNPGAVSNLQGSSSNITSR